MSEIPNVSLRFYRIGIELLDEIARLSRVTRNSSAAAAERTVLFALRVFCDEFDKSPPLAYYVLQASGVIRETGSGNLPLETARCLDPQGSMCGRAISRTKNLHGTFRRLMKVGGFFVLLVRDP